MTPEDNVHVWTNYLKNFKMPTVESRRGRRITVGRLQLPVVSASIGVPGGVLILAAIMFSESDAHSGASVRTPVILIIAAGVLLMAIVDGLYPFARVYRLRNRRPWLPALQHRSRPTLNTRPRWLKHC